MLKDILIIDIAPIHQKRKSIEVPNFEFKNEDDITEDTKRIRY